MSDRGEGWDQDVQCGFSRWSWIGVDLEFPFHNQPVNLMRLNFPG
jgi:hypothetical protein